MDPKDAPKPHEIYLSGFPKGQTPIEVLAKYFSDGVWAHDDPYDGGIDTVLVPEQCMSIFLGGKNYHVTIEEMPS
jgi:hypothetical protein